MSRWTLRRRSSYPWPWPPGEELSFTVEDRETIEEIRRNMPNGAHFDVVEIVDLKAETAARRLRA